MVNCLRIAVRDDMERRWLHCQMSFTSHFISSYDIWTMTLVTPLDLARDFFGKVQSRSWALPGRTTCPDDGMPDGE